MPATAWMSGVFPAAAKPQVCRHLFDMLQIGFFRRFRPVFRYVKEQQEKKEIRSLKALIYFTDGDGIYPGSKPDYETAFVFLHKTEKMELVPPWAIRLVAEQEGVRYRT